MKRSVLQKISFMFFLLMSTAMFSQTIDGKIRTWTTTIKTTLNAAVACFAVVGGFLIFIQYMQGKSEAQQNFVKFVIGLAIFGVADLIVNVFI